MKPVSPLVDIATLFVFLIALTINCVQASQITLDSVWASVPVFGESVSTKTDQSAFLVADDESDDSANLGIARDIISPIEAVQFFHTRSRWFVVVVKVKHATVLRI